MSKKICANCRWMHCVFFDEPSIGECMIDGKVEARDDLRYGGYPVVEARSRGCSRFEPRVGRGD